MWHKVGSAADVRRASSLNAPTLGRRHNKLHACLLGFRYYSVSCVFFLFFLLMLGFRFYGVLCVCAFFHSVLCLFFSFLCIQVFICAALVAYSTRICAAEMAVRYAALCACRKVHT